MSWAAVKSAWESGRLVFRRKADNAGLFAISASSRFTRFLTITALEDDDTITAAAIKGGLITYADAACGGTLTFDTGANIEAAYPGIQTGECIEFYIVNTGTTTGTLAADDACAPTVSVIDASQTIGANESAKIVLRKSDEGEFVAYCIGA